MENRHLGASRGAFFLGRTVARSHQLAAWIGRRLLFSPRGGHERARRWPDLQRGRRFSLGCGFRPPEFDATPAGECPAFQG
ncbi:hypothetical protein BTL54_11445 [Bordetella parapertussis]|nr:hypothetical protein BTL54_11445 [Bordetella parapertussis]QBS57397.1 hypothetical protein B2B88_11440 [Bordetella parapertussis]